MMPSFIGRPLKDCITYCNKNGLEFIVKYNSCTKDEENLTDFVIKTYMEENKLIIVASKFKIEV